MAKQPLIDAPDLEDAALQALPTSTPQDLTASSGEDQDLLAVKAGKLKPYQVKSPTARRAAYDWYANPQNRQPVVPMADANSMLDNAFKANEMTMGQVPASRPLMPSGGFSDRNAPLDIENVRRGAMRPDEIQNPAVRASVYAMLQNDPQFAAEFRRNRLAQTRGVGIPANPEDVARAEEDLRNGVGVPVPEYDRDALIRRKIERDRGQWTESRTARRARQIAKMDPRRWDAEIEQFNQRHAGEAFIRRDDIVKAGGRQQAAPSFGRYGDAPQVIQPNPMQGPGGRGSSGTIQTQFGDYRPQMVYGRQMAVPVLQTPSGSAIPNAGELTKEEFGDVLTARDSAEIKRGIYQSGQAEWVSQVRKIDSAYAALESDTLSSTEREQAESEIRRQEDDLFYRWVRSNGHAMAGVGDQKTLPRGGGTGGMQEIPDREEEKRRAEEERDMDYRDRQTLSDRRKMIERATQIKEDYPDISDDEAIRQAEDEFAGNPSALRPRTERSRTRSEREVKPDFDPTKFSSAFNERVERGRKEVARALEELKKTREWNRAGGQLAKEREVIRASGIPQEDAIAKRALQEAFIESGGNSADFEAHEKASEEALFSVLERYKRGEIDKSRLVSIVRPIVYRHLPAHYDKIVSQYGGSVESIVGQIANNIIKSKESAK